MAQAEYSGFWVSLPSAAAAGTLRLEAKIGGEWHVFFSAGSGPGSNLNWFDYARDRVRGVLARPSTQTPLRFEGLDRGYVCWIDQPHEWRKIDRQFQLSGWCFRKNGEPIEGIRVCIQGHWFSGYHGLSRPDVVAVYGDRPGALRSGFEVAVEVPRGATSVLRLEARHSDHIWKGVFQKRIRVSSRSPRKPQGDRVATSGSYETWIGCYDTLTLADRFRIKNQVRALKSKPRFSILIPIGNPVLDHLEATLKSVRGQIYPHWQLCVVHDPSSPEPVRRLLARYAKLDSRIEIRSGREEGVVGANEALAFAGGDFVAYLESEDKLAPTALYFCTLEIDRHPEAGLLYSDEDRLDPAGHRIDPHFKPGWNRELFLSHNYVAQLSVFRADLIKSLGFRVALGESARYDLLLRCIERIEPGQIRHVPWVLYHRRAPPKITAGATRVVKEHLQRCGIAAEVVASRDETFQRVRYLATESRSLVSIVIPTRDMVELLKPCVASILERTTYPRFEIILVDNGSRDPAALEHLAQVSRDPRVRLLRREEEFNYSRLNNAGVQGSEAKFVALVNNDVVVIDPEWLDEMVSHGKQPNVGAVGPRLLYPDSRIQQAGVILGAGVHGVAEVAYRGLPKGNTGYFGRAALAQELSAVGAACMLVRRAVYLEVGGFDEEHLKVGFNDIDFCLKLRARGYRIVYTPYAELYHLEHASRGFEDTVSKRQRFDAEIEYMKEKWGQALLFDPAYNPNLSLGKELFALSFPPRGAKPWRKS